MLTKKFILSMSWIEISKEGSPKCRLSNSFGGGHSDGSSRGTGEINLAPYFSLFFLSRSRAYRHSFSTSPDFIELTDQKSKKTSDFFIALAISSRHKSPAFILWLSIQKRIWGAKFCMATSCSITLSLSLWEYETNAFLQSFLTNRIGMFLTSRYNNEQLTFPVANLLCKASTAQIRRFNRICV